MTNKEALSAYLQDNFPDNATQLMSKFEAYYAWLIEINQHLNLISRKTDPETIWTTHILDSLLIHSLSDFKNQEILDFGTGGGFPGIPLAILYPSSTIHLLDSKRKKVNALAEACKTIGISNCRFIHARIEDLDFYYAESFDTILSRSVRITPELKGSLLALCKKGGKVFLYKSLQLEDVTQFKKYQIHDVSRPDIGTRKIAEISK